MKEVIAKLITNHIGKNVKKEDIEKIIEIPPSSDLGDFAFPCFFLASVLKKSPQQIAQELAKKLKAKEFERIEAKQSYLNFFVNKDIYAEQVLEIDENFGKQKKKGKIVIDFSAPNIGKPMHVGHIRSTIIGDSILRIYDFLGYNVLGINYLGDIGLHIGKLIVAWELWLDQNALKKDPAQELLRLYVKFCDKEKTEYQEDLEEKFQDNEWTQKAKEKLKLLELGDKNAHKIWREITESSKKGFDRVYKMLNVNFHETTGQSLFSAKGKEIITEQLKKGRAHVEEDGAVYVDELELNGEKLPKKYILRSNGTASYMTQDIGAAFERYKKYKFDKMIYVTDYRQELHFKQLFAIIKKFGFDFSEKLVHVGFGTVNFGGEILATRKGRVILLEDVLKKTIERAEQETKKRKTKGDPESIGIASVKYAILKNSPQQDVNFSWEQALNFEGDTGPYLQYSYARASSILRKAKSKKTKLAIPPLHPSEIELIKNLLKFPETVEQAASHLSPAIIANYSFQLAQAFNEFYHACPVLKSENEQFRIELVTRFRIVMASSLDLLGIDVLEEM